MRPILFEIGDLTFYSYTATFTLGFVVAALLADRHNRRLSRPYPVTTMAGIWAFVGGTVGAKLYWVIQYGTWEDWKWLSFLLNGGMVFLGGLFGGIFMVVLYLRWVGAPILPVADLVSPYLALAHGIARVGCFLNGCCWGSRTCLPWGVCYPRSGWGAYRQQLDAGLLSSGAKVSLPVHPVQLYETVFLWVLFGLLLWAYPRRKRHGDLFLGYLVLYGLGRFLLETLRGDEPRHVLGLTATQFVCMAMVAGGLAALAWLPRKPAGDADPPGTPGLDTSPAMNTASPGTGPEAGE